jgi:hypothetical protein
MVSRAGLEGEQARARYTVAARQTQLDGQSAGLTLASLRAQAELFHAGKTDWPDLILRFNCQLKRRCWVPRPEPIMRAA